MKINKWLSIKKEKEYPWPCKAESERTILLFKDDVLTKNEEGTYTKHTGLCCFGIEIPDKDIVKHVKPAHLVLI